MDAIIAMVLALNHSDQVLAKRNKSLADFTYKDKEMAELFKTSLSKVSFPGFSVSNQVPRGVVLGVILNIVTVPNHSAVNRTRATT